MTGDFLFNTGLVIMGGAVVCAIAVVIGLGLRKRRLKKQLEVEYGKRRH